MADALRALPVTVSLQVTDTASGPDGVTLVAAASSQPQNGLGDGNTANDIQGFGAPTLSVANGSYATYTDPGYLRAERSGNQKDGRRNTLTYRGSNVEGNSADCVVTVKVPHDQRPPQ
jgi:endo-1,4-beta-xylanase